MVEHLPDTTQNVENKKLHCRKYMQHVVVMAECKIAVTVANTVSHQYIINQKWKNFHYLRTLQSLMNVTVLLVFSVIFPPGTVLITDGTTIYHLYTTPPCITVEC